VKTTLAILFSLSLVWAQFAWGGATSAASQPAACKCCGCGGTDCCVSESSSPTSTPVPAPPVRAAFENGISFSATAGVAWVLPVLEIELAAPSSFGFLWSAGVPLFTRHCALLI